MRQLRQTRSWLVLVLGLLLPAPAALAQAQAHAVEARQYFAAGAAAYSAGDYQAAIQAFDAAYASTPLPAIAFSLAQAERRQYLATHEPAHLQRAISLFREYLAKVGSGGRRADATDALAQLELLALSASRDSSGAGVSVGQAEQKTRLLIRCQTPHASIAVDGSPPAASPVIREVTPGPHRIEVSADGFFPVTQQTVALQGELLPVEIELRQRPARLIVDGHDGEEIYIDGNSAGADRKELQLVPGPHLVSFAKKGHVPRNAQLQLAAGETQHVSANLHTTDQRIAAVSLFIAGGATLATGAVFSALALDREGTAKDIDRQRQSSSITPADRARYLDALEDRDRLRVAATIGLAGAAAALVTGLLLYQLDDRAPEVAPSYPTHRVELAPSADGQAFNLRLTGRL